MSLYRAIEHLAVFNPAFISVTYGAMGTTQALTHDLVIDIRDRFGIPTIPHLTCVGATKDEIAAYVETFKREGIDHILALRGDPPQGMTSFVKPEGGFEYASELVAFLKTLGDFHLSVAGYPEGHREAPDFETDLHNLKRKVDAGAESVITQLFFDTQIFAYFVERAKQLNIRVPIIPGIMPILNFGQIKRVTDMCGASLPEPLVRALRACETDEAKMAEVGREWALQQSRDLIAQGVPGLHFYILNKAESTAWILERLA